MKKLNKFTHKILPFLLIGVIASSAVSLNYNKIREVKAVAVVDDVALAGIITLILLSYGYVTMDYYSNTDGTSALAQDWEDAYETARFKVLEGGGGTGDSGDDNNDDDFEDTDGDGKITENDIPTWAKIVSSIGVSGAVSVAISKNASKLLSPIITSYVMKRKGYDYAYSNEIKDLNNAIRDNPSIDLSAYNTSAVSRYGDLVTKIYAKNGSVYISGKVYTFDTNNEYLKIFYSSSKKAITNIDTGVKLNSMLGPVDLSANKSYKYLFFNCPLFNSYDDYKNKTTQPTIWVTPDLQDTFNNNTSLNLLPPFDPLASYNIPTQQALQGLLNGLNDANISPDGQQDLLKDFLNTLKNEPTSEPDKEPDKKPDSGDSGKDNPDGKPDSGGNSSSDKENASFTADLKKLFPFCIPFDLVDCFRLFNAEPTTPKVEIPVHFGIVNVDYTFVISLQDFNNVAMICRSMFLILYIVGLILATRHLIRG